MISWSGSKSRKGGVNCYPSEVNVFGWKATTSITRTTSEIPRLWTVNSLDSMILSAASTVITKNRVWLPPNLCPCKKAMKISKRRIIAVKTSMGLSKGISPKSMKMIAHCLKCSRVPEGFTRGEFITIPKRLKQKFYAVPRLRRFCSECSRI